MQGVQDIGGQTVVKKKPKDVVAVMPGRLKPYSYFVLGCGAVPDFLKQAGKTIHVVWDGEHICQDFTFRVENEAVVLVL